MDFVDVMQHMTMITCLGDDTVKFVPPGGGVVLPYSFQ